MALRAASPLGFRVRCVVGFLAIHVSVAAGARAQQGSGILRGVVTDSSGAAIAAADVAIVALHQVTRTDDHGLFSIGKLPRGGLEVSIRRLGYEPVTVRFTVTDAYADSINVKLTALPEMLSAVGVSAPEVRRRSAIEDFYRRRARGIGTFFTREDILARGARMPTDMLRTSPGLQIVRVPGGLGVRFSSAASARRGCIPTIWVDGQRAQGMEIDELPISDIEGMELYHGPATTPPQFWQGNAVPCGTIVVWSRSPGT